MQKTFLEQIVSNKYVLAEMIVILNQDTNIPESDDLQY